MLSYENLDTQQKKAYDTIISGKNVFLSGDAGTGKSTVVNLALSNLKNNVIALAPTGVAADNIGGMTIHSFLHITPQTDIFKKPTGRIVNQLKKIVMQNTTIVIDEISMCSIALFDYLVDALTQAKMRWGLKSQLQYILVGDFLQLPPVVTNNDLAAYQHKYPDIKMPYYCFNSSNWKSLSLNNIILKKAQRQKDNQEFQYALNTIRSGRRVQDSVNWFNENAILGLQNFDSNVITLTGTNQQASNYNKQMLDQLDTDEYCFVPDSHIEHVKYARDTLQTLVLKEGARVMSLINGEDYNTGDTYFNGKIGTVTEIEADSDINYAEKDDDVDIWVEFDDGTKASFTWQKQENYLYKIDEKGHMVKQSKGYVKTIPLKLAYAVTIHKAQGQTYTKGANVELTIFAAGQLYVALSRVTNIKNLHLSKALTQNQVMTDWQVVQFYQSIDKGEDMHIFDPILNSWLNKKQYDYIKSYLKKPN